MRGTCTVTTCAAPDASSRRFAEFEAADRLHREYATREKIPAEYDWHFEHNLGLLATSLQYAGQMKRAETLLKTAFALPTNLLVQAYNKREWPMFLRARGRTQDAVTAAQTLIADPNPVIQAHRPHRARLRDARRAALGRCRHGLEQLR